MSDKQPSRRFWERHVGLICPATHPAAARLVMRRARGRLHVFVPGMKRYLRVRP